MTLDSLGGLNYYMDIRVALYCKQLEMESILDFLGKKNRKKKRQWFWSQNRNLKSPMVLKQSVSRLLGAMV